MSIVINGSGTITGITAGGLPDATITQAELATGVAGTGPAFSASTGSFSVTNSTNTNATLTTETFDTGSCFNNTGSTVDGIPAYAFKPNVAGYYIVTSGVQYTGPAYAGYFVNYLYKNGIAYRESVSAASQYDWAYLSTVMYLDGVNDYIQTYARQAQGSTQTMAANFSAALVRAA